MKIEKIEIENFRGFRGKHEVVFQPDVNVFVGVNGAGKSSVLDLLGNILGFLIHEITPNYKTPLALDNADVSFETMKTRLTAIFSTEENQHFGIALKYELPTYNLLLTGLGISTNGFETDFSSSKMKNYPIFRYFHNKRVWQNSEELTDLKYLPPEMAAYVGCFHSLNSFEKFAKWFKEHEDDENRIKIRTKNINYEAPLLETVRKAINTFLSQFGDLKMDNIRVDDAKTIYNDINDLCLDKNGVKHNLNQLSSGEQTIILLVADIGHHLAIANPNLVNKTQGTGIVLIDEIDIHLHPAWQRDIISALTKTFPNIQFFITSHSPFIVSSTHKSQLYIIENEDGQSNFKTVLFNPYGKPANQILIDFFQLEGTRTRKVDNELKALREMVKKEEYDTQAFKTAYESLTSEIGKADQDLISINLEIAKRKKIYEKN